MIFLVLNHGGLGNQLYQYAVARKLQEQYKDKIVCDVSKFKYRGTNATPRPMELQQLKLNSEIEFGEYIWYKMLYKVKRIINEKLYSKLDLPNKYKKMTKNGLFLEVGGYFTYYKEEKTKRKIKYVNGMFQSYKYFEDIKPILQKELVVKDKNLSMSALNMIKQLKEENSVCVHWRRGDYLDNQYSKNLLICDYDYYKKAIERIKSKVENPVFYLFTNSTEDAEYIKNNYFLHESVQYINIILKETSDLEDFAIMCNCKHYIISNSTFSWWAQYLNDNPKKIVCAPSKWTRKEDAKELYMEKWEIIPV